MKTARQILQERLDGKTSTPTKGHMPMRERREGLGLSQQEVAAALDVPAIQISRWETGGRAVSLQDAFRLAAFYECTVDELFSNLRVEVQQ